MGGSRPPATVAADYEGLWALLAGDSLVRCEAEGKIQRFSLTFSSKPYLFVASYL